MSEPTHERILRYTDEEAAAYADDAAEALRESVKKDGDKTVDWKLLAKRRLRAALALIGGMD